MKKITFTIAFKALILLFIAYLLYLLTIIAMNLKTIAKNSDKGRYLPSGNAVLDSKTGKEYISIGDKLIDVK